MAKKKVTLSIESKTYSDFKKYCDENAVMLSKKIEIFMDNFMKHSKGKRLAYVLMFFLSTLLISTLTSASSPSVSFVSPTPAVNVSGNSIYVNLSTSDGHEHYSFVNFDNDLKVWIRMSEVSGSTILDLSGYGNNGTMVSSPVINSSNGRFGNGTRFDGLDDYISINDSASINATTNGKMTFCLWMNPRSTSSPYSTMTAPIGQWRTMIGAASVNERSWGLLEEYNSVDGKYTFAVSANGGSPYGTVSTDSVVPLNQWTHICGTFDSPTMRLYVNGAVQTGSGSSSGMYNAPCPLTIGTYLFTANGTARPSDIYFNGSVDEVLIFNRTLNLTEIKAVYNASAYRFEHNYTSLANGSHTFTGYAVDSSGNLNSTARTITSGSNSSGNQTNQSALNITLLSPTVQYNTFAVWASTNAAASSCWFTSNGGITNVSMYENSSMTFYYEDFDYGNYSISFYCQNTNETANLTRNFEFKKSYVTSDQSYVNSQGLRIYFDFGFNYTAENGGLVIIPDSWTAVKDATWVNDAENYFIARGYAAAPINTRGKGSSEGTKDAFGWECLDIYELVQYLESTYPYNSYVNSSRIYIAGASGAGGKAGVCTAKYPDAFAAGYSSVGVLNLTLWWQTAGSADVAEIVTRVGCNPNQCPEAYLARDASYLGYNTQSPMKAKSNADDDRVTVNCSRNYNNSMIGYGKVMNYTENPTGGHTPDFTSVDEWFIQYTSPVFMPSSGDLRVGGYVHTKNFSIYLNETSINHTVFVSYSIAGDSKTFNITTWGFNGIAKMNLSNLASGTNYSITAGGVTAYSVSDAGGRLAFSVNLSNYSSKMVNVSQAVISEYCGDGSCNNGESCSSCSADCGTCSSSGGGGGGSTRKAVIGNNTNGTLGGILGFGIPGLYVESPASVVANPGESRKVSLNVKNSGTAFLNRCKIAGSGNYALWIESGDVKDLSIGQMSEFVAALNIPSDVSPGSYDLNFSVTCNEATKDSTVRAEVIKKKLAVELTDTKLDKNGNLLVTYTLSELTGESQNVSVEFVLLDLKGARVAEATEQRNMESLSRTSFEIALKVADSIEGGNFNLLINANSEIASAFVQDYVIFDKKSISGLALSGLGDKGSLVTAILVMSFLVFAFFIGRRILRFKGISDRKNVVSSIVAGHR